MGLLPNSFPEDDLSRIDRSKVKWYYQLYVKDYYDEYLFGHFILAAYASVPALLTSDLLYKLWQNFNLYTWNDQKIQIHRIAIADLLLSPLCREVSHGLYEMEEDIRNTFLKWLEKESKGERWADRNLHTPQKIAAFIREYHYRRNPGETRWGQSYKELQNWNTLTFLEPEAAQQQLQKKLEDSIAKGHNNQALRVLDFWSKSESRVDILFEKDSKVNEQFKANSHFADAWKSLLHRNSDAFIDKIKENPDLVVLLNDVKEGGIPVRIPKIVKEEVEKLANNNTPDQDDPSTKQGQLYALLIGINDYHPESKVPPLNSPVNDVRSVEALLRNNYHHLLSEETASNIRVLTDAEASRENIIRSFLEHLGQAEEGDIALFYFSGHGSYEPTSVEFEYLEEDGVQSTIVCYDSRLPDQNDLADKELAWLLSKIATGVQIVNILECCHSGGMNKTRSGQKETSQRATIEDRSKKRAIESYLLPDLNYFRDQIGRKEIKVPQSPQITLSACAGDQNSKDTAEQRGAFTLHLERAIERTKGAISYAHLIKQIQTSIKTEVSDQTPQLHVIGSNPNLQFLGFAPIEIPSYPIAWDPQQSRWIMQYGFADGAPTEAFDIAELQISIIPKDAPPETVGEEAKLIEIQKNTSILDFEGENPEQSYIAQIITTPDIKPLRVWLTGEGQEQFLSHYQKNQSPYIRFDTNNQNYDYELKTDEEQLRLYHTPSKRLITGVITISASTVQEELVPSLRKIARWHRFHEMNLKRGGLNYDDVSLILNVNSRDEKASRNSSIEVSGPSHDDIMVWLDKGEEEWIQKNITVEAQNNSEQELYVCLLYFSDQFEITVIDTRVLRPGANAEELLADQLQIDSLRQPESIVTLQLLISTAPIEAEDFTQSEVQVGQMGTLARKASYPGGNTYKPNPAGWLAKKATFHILGQQHGLRVDKVTIDVPYDINIGFASLYAHSRMNDPIIRLANRFSPKDFSFCNLTNIEERSDQSIIILDQLNRPNDFSTTPLTINVNLGENPRHHLLPVTIDDNDIILSFGEEQRNSERSHISIRHLPIEQDSYQENKTLRFGLLQTTFPESINLEDKLQWVDYSKTAKDKRVSEGLKEQVQKAQKILLLIPGVLEDSQYMAQQCQFAKDELGHDLVLTYDYSLEEYPIEEVGALLAKNLLSAGLSPEDDKTLCIVAHSVGGLLARFMIRKMRPDMMVDRLIMLGTPNAGLQYVELDSQLFYFGFIIALNERQDAIHSAWDKYLKYGVEGSEVSSIVAFLQPDSELLTSLNQADDSENATMYCSILGNLSTQADPDPLILSAQKVMGELNWNEPPGDLFVNTASISALPPALQENVAEVGCHHFAYFNNEESIAALREFLSIRYDNEERIQAEDIPIEQSENVDYETPDVEPVENVYEEGSEQQQEQQEQQEQKQQKEQQQTAPPSTLRSIEDVHEKAEQFIAERDFEAAFDFLNDAINSSSDRRNDIVMQQSQYYSNKKQLEKGLIDTSSSQLTLNRITYVMISIIKDIKEEDLREGFLQANPATASTGSTTDQPDETESDSGTPRYMWCLDNGHGKLTPGKRSPLFSDGESQVLKTKGKRAPLPDDKKLQFFEYEFNRDIVQRIAAQLKERGIQYFEVAPNVEEIDNTLKERIERINSYESELPKLLVSVHCNAGPSKSAQEWASDEFSGIETWYFHGSKQGEKLAGVFQNHLIEATGWKNRGLKSRESNQFYILRESKMPAVLTENGAYNNKVQVRELMKDNVRQAIAEAHVAAIEQIEREGV